MSELQYPSVSRVMNVTAFKDERTAEAAIATLHWLDSGAPHKFNGCEETVYFDMRKFIGSLSCGTACCLAGAIELHKNPEKEKRNKQFGGRFQLEDTYNLCADDRSNPLVQLFFPLDEHRIIIGKSAEEAAKTLRHYLFSGEVNWNLGE